MDITRIKEESQRKEKVKRDGAGERERGGGGRKWKREN